MKERKEPKTFKIGKCGWSSRQNLWYFKYHYKNSYTYKSNKSYSVGTWVQLPALVSTLRLIMNLTYSTMYNCKINIIIFMFRTELLMLTIDRFYLNLSLISDSKLVFILSDSQI